MKAIEIRNLGYAYKSNWSWKRTSVIEDLNLDVEEGESFGFLGHNGAGKTTTIKCILGLIEMKKSSSVRIFGAESKDVHSRRYVGYLPEQPYFYDHLTVEELMNMYSVLYGVSERDRKQYVKEALGRVDIAFKKKSRMRNLSKGQTQRVAMAQAILAKPKLLILDEPFSGLDPLGRKEFADLIFSLKKEGTTIFMSSHILSDVENVCDRASIMINGELKGVFDLGDTSKLGNKSYELVIQKIDDSENEVFKLADSVTDRSKTLSLNFSEKNKAERALKSCLDQKLVLESFKSDSGNLEDFFVELMKVSKDN